MRKELLIALLFLSLVSCETDDSDPIIEEPEVISEGVFTVDLLEGYPYGIDEVWLILHDLDGKPIDYAEVGTGGKAEFDVDRAGRYHLSLYYRNTLQGMDINTIQTYTNIKATRNITFGLSRTGRNIPEPTGNFEAIIKFNDYGNFGYTSSSFNTTNSGSYWLDYDLHMTTPIYPNEKKYLVAGVNNEGRIGYTYISNPENDKTYSFDFESLNSYDRLVKIENPAPRSITYSVNAMTELNGFYHYGYAVSRNTSNRSSVELGYLNEYKTYSTLVSASTPPGAKTQSFYYQLGEIPEKITLLTIPEINVLKNQITDFNFTLFPEATEYVVTFDYPIIWEYPDPIKNVRWFVYGNSPTFSMELPEEIKNTYPLLSNLGKMQLESIAINKNSYSYDEFIFDQFVEYPKLKTYTSQSVVQYYPKN